MMTDKFSALRNPEKKNDSFHKGIFIREVDLEFNGDI